MDEVETLSHHSIINLEHKNYESKFHKCWEILISFKYSNIISILNIILSICVVGIYIYSTYEPNIVLIYSKYFFSINFSSRCFFTILLVIDIIKGRYDFTFKSISTLLLEIVSVIPYLFSRITVGMKEDLISTAHLVTSAFICLRLFKILSLSKFIRSDVNRELFNIMASLICLVFIFTILVNVIENAQTIGNYCLFLPRDCYNAYLCEGSNDTLHSTLFFIMTTIGIIGYNSTISSLLGRLIIIGVIIFSVYEIPSQCSDLMVQLSSKSIYARTTYKKLNGVEFILISGNVSVGSLIVLLKEYFHPDHGENERHALILMPQSPDNNMKSVLQDYPNKLFYLEGDPLKFNDLQRCQFKKASMIMLLCNKQTDDSSAEDSKTIIMAMAIKKFYSLDNGSEFSEIYKNQPTTNLYRTKTLMYPERENTLPSFQNYTSNKPTNILNNRVKEEENDDKISSKLIIQLLRPESEHHFALSVSNKKTIDQIVCIDELKISLLAKSCLCRGIISLISNLVITNNFDEEMEKQIGKLHWIEEYKNGKDYEIYKIPLDHSGGYKFIQVADKIYNEKNTILFGLNLENKAANLNVVLLSPMDFVLPTNKDLNIYGYILAKDQGDADEVTYWEKSMKKNFLAKSEDEDFFSPKNSKDTEESEIKENDEEKNGNDKENVTADVVNLGKICHITTEHIDKIDVTVESIDKMLIAKDHIIICGICHNLIDFIKPLRSKKLPKNILSTIVILSKELPDDKLWNTIAYFEQIYLVQGDAMKKTDLKRAGIRSAKRVVILAPSINEISQFTENQRLKNLQKFKNDDENENYQEIIEGKLSREEEDLLDSKTIFKYNMISKINKNIFCVIELINPKNVSFLNNLNRRSNDEYRFIKAGLTIDATASFAAGEVYYSSIMDNVITQAYYNPSLLSVLKKLIVGDEIQNNFKRESIINKYSNVPSGSLYLIDLPLSLFQKSSKDVINNIKFDKIFNCLLKKKIIVIGIYRYGFLNQTSDSNPINQINNHKDSNFYFVVTAPEGNFLVNTKDKLFVISPEYPKPEMLEKNQIKEYFQKDEEIEFKDNLRVKTRKMSGNEVKKKEFDEEAEIKLTNFNQSLENTKILLEDIEESFNKISKESNKYIKNSVQKKLYNIKNLN